MEYEPYTAKIKKFTDDLEPRTDRELQERQIYYLHQIEGKLTAIKNIAICVLIIMLTGAYYILWPLIKMS